MSTSPAPQPEFATAFSDPSRAHRVRAEVEAALNPKYAGALSPAPRMARETLLCGIAELDALGGFPLGAITELVGPISSGRTGVAMRTMAEAMREGNTCAWVDAMDSFDPESAAANGVCLEQLLWVRCGMLERAPAAQVVAQGERREEPARSHVAGLARAGWHPRDEVRGLDKAVGELLRVPPADPGRNKSIGTPGMPNRAIPRVGTPRCCPPEDRERERRPFGRVVRDEQPTEDRRPKRRPADPVLSAPVRAGTWRNAKAGLRETAGKPWARLDQALRATDLLLQTGGFRVVVLDLGSVTVEHVLKIPLATWFRFRAAADQSRAVLLTLTQAGCAKSSAGMAVAFSPLQTEVHETTVLERVRYQASTARLRFAPGVQPVVAIDDRPAKRPAQATWQWSAYPMREQVGS